MLRRAAAIVWVMALVVAGLCLVGQLFRDRLWLTGLCFYLPSPLVAVGLLLAAAGIRRWSRRRARVAAFLVLPPLFWVVAVENQWSRPICVAEPGRQFRLVFWNVANANLGWPGVQQALQQAAAD